MRIKEKLVDVFGALGGILYTIYMLISFVLPVVMIKISFDLSFGITPIMILILFIIPSASFVFWVIGLIGVILGPQDVIAIIYYIFFTLACLPTAIFAIFGFFTKD